MTREIARNTHLVPNDEEVKMENQAKMREHELERKDYISGGGVLPMTSRQPSEGTGDKQWASAHYAIDNPCSLLQ